MDITSQQENNPPWPDSVWDYRPYGKGYHIHDALLSGMEEAISNLVANHPEDFSILKEQHLRNSNFETIQFLLIRAYTANGEIFADEAIDYLCEQPVRLKTGYLVSNGNTLAAPYWATRQLIEATTPHCTEENLVKLETLIISYYEPLILDSVALKFRGYPQLLLLDAIDSSRRTEIANRRLQEWKRKFTALQLIPSDKIEPPEEIIASFVGSPIPNKSADRMMDQQWLKAIARYDCNDPKYWLQRNGKFVGGAYQLSSLLESQVKKEPIRFAKLIWQFPDNANSSYFDAVLRGLAEVELDVKTAFMVCQRCHQLPNYPCGRCISWLMGKLPDLAWSEEAFDIVTWYALNDSNPEQETSNGQVYYDGDILNVGINSTRGSAVSAIAQLILAYKNRASYFREHLQKIVQDSSIAVRSCAVEALTAMLNYDRDLAVSLFQRLCDTEDALLGTQTVEYFLFYALQTHFEVLASIVERMIMCELPEVVKIGTRQACVASLNIEEARWLAELCLSGTETHRIAAAEIFVTNFRIAHFRKFCEDTLIRLFQDASEQVRSQAARCFLHFEGDELGDYISLVEAFVDSRAFYNDDYNLIHALEKTTAKLPNEVTYRVCDRFLEGLRSDDADVRERGSIKADEVSQLLLQLYSQKDPNLKLRCLDLIDFMTQMEVYKLAEVLTQYDR